jgi:ribosomal-protein-alanine N-acetyltransferase
LSANPLIPSFNFGPFPLLESERLILRRLTRADADDVMRFKGDYAVTRYNGGQPYADRTQALDLIDRLDTGYAERRSIAWGITLKPDDVVIGITGYKYWNRIDYRAAIGYDLAQTYWGRGLMPEAVRAILAFGFEQMALNRVEADADVANLASIRVLQKVGFQSEGFQMEQYYEDGAFHDIALFGLLRRHFLRP